MQQLTSRCPPLTVCEQPGMSVSSPSSRWSASEDFLLKNCLAGTSLFDSSIDCQK